MPALSVFCFPSAMAAWVLHGLWWCFFVQRTSTVKQFSVVFILFSSRGVWWLQWTTVKSCPVLREAPQTSETFTKTYPSALMGCWLLMCLFIEKKKEIKIWDAILFRKQRYSFTKALSALVRDRNQYVVINKEIFPPYLSYLFDDNAFRNNVSLIRRSGESWKPMMLFPSSKRQIPTCASVFRASDITTRWQCSYALTKKKK